MASSPLPPATPPGTKSGRAETSAVGSWNERPANTTGLHWKRGLTSSKRPGLRRRSGLEGFLIDAIQAAFEGVDPDKPTKTAREGPSIHPHGSCRDLLPFGSTLCVLVLLGRRLSLPMSQTKASTKSFD